MHGEETRSTHRRPLWCVLLALLAWGLASAGRASAVPAPPALNGIDVLRQEGFARLRGARVGLITNHTGRDLEGRSTIDVLRAAPGVTLVCLFSPEHGLRGLADEAVPSAVDRLTGLPIHSLYGEHRRPTAAMLAGVDTLVFDIQDVGTRFYTYISTLGLAMEAAALHHLRFVVLDRVNPINGMQVEGPLADADRLSFTAYHALPVRHGMTTGELARLFNQERQLGARLEVVPLRGWRREAWFDETGQLWRNPSPNMRSLAEATLYPGIGLLEATNLSVGRGTDTPFEVVGAPFIDARTLAAELRGAGLAGVTFVPVQFTPRASVHAGVECHGVNVVVTDRARFSPVACGLAIAATLRRLHPGQFRVDGVDRLLVNRRLAASLARGASLETLLRACEEDAATFRRRRQPHLLY